MTFKGYLIASLVQWVGLVFLKAWFFNSQIFAEPGTQELAYWILAGIFIVAVVRRLGYINYLEALFVVVTWTILNSLLDLMLLSSYTGLRIFSTHMYWGACIVMVIAILVFHKKRHVKIRNELHAKGHGGHH